MTQLSITDQFDRQTNSDSEPRRSERIFFRGNHPGLQNECRRYPKRYEMMNICSCNHFKINKQRRGVNGIVSCCYRHPVVAFTSK
jgi:hypothetical protein